MNTRQLKARDMAYIATGAALTAICSWISIPTLVPFTMQTFAVFAVLGLLGGKRGTLSILVYLLLGAVGLPVFAGFKGGLGGLLGLTGGYLLGFLLSGLLYWLTERLLGQRLWSKALGMTLGLAACYLFGTLWYVYLYSRGTGPISVAVALGRCVLPFIAPDLIKMALALLLTRLLQKRLQLQQNP